MKQFKKHQVHLLPTSNDSRLYKIGDTLYCSTVTSPHIDKMAQHLYVFSDEEIKENDWIFWKGRIVHAIDSTYTSAKKIIASTDDTLGLPRLPLLFIQKYVSYFNSHSPIFEIMVEYDNWVDTDGNIAWGNKEAETIKINSDHTINIISIKPMNNSYTKEEVEAILIKYAFEHTETSVLKLTKWIKENL